LNLYLIENNFTRFWS